jgi:hypothetical protein
MSCLQMVGGKISDNHEISSNEFRQAQIRQ